MSPTPRTKPWALCFCGPVASPPFLLGTGNRRGAQPQQASLLLSENQHWVLNSGHAGPRRRRALSRRCGGQAPFPSHTAGNPRWCILDSHLAWCIGQHLAAVRMEHVGTLILKPRTPHPVQTYCMSGLRLPSNRGRRRASTLLPLQSRCEADSVRRMALRHSAVSLHAGLEVSLLRECLEMRPSAGSGHMRIPESQQHKAHGPCSFSRAWN